jgi:glycosyltransferase involved in cell wall biosynthesis
MSTFSPSSSTETGLEVSVVVCTRNRGSSVVATLESIFSNSIQPDEVVLIDQSENEETACAIAPFLERNHFHYYPSTTKGAGRARNEGIRLSKGKYILMTDDDCTAPDNWVGAITNIFNQHPSVGIIFSTVAAGPHDCTAGAIPNLVFHQSRQYRNIWQYYKSGGMGASMALRRAALNSIGTFDEMLGPGSTFLSGEDHDLALRALLHQWNVYEAAEVTVLHHGFRTMAEYRLLTKRDAVAVGAVHAKYIRCAKWNVLAVMAYHLFVKGLWQPFSMIFRLKFPRGVKRFTYYWKGFFQGLRTPVDCTKIIYHTPETSTNKP